MLLKKNTVSNGLKVADGPNIKPFLKELLSDMIKLGHCEYSPTFPLDFVTYTRGDFGIAGNGLL